MRNRCAPKAYVKYAMNSKSVCLLSPLNANTINVNYYFDPRSADLAVRANSDLCLFCVAPIPHACYECEGGMRNTHTHLTRSAILPTQESPSSTSSTPCTMYAYRPAYLSKDFVQCSVRCWKTARA